MRCQNPFAFRPVQVSFWTTVVYLAVVVPLLYVHETVPPAPADRSLYRGLNLTEAWLDLQTITDGYHPYNSHRNDEVRDFIISRCKQILGHNGVDYATEVLGGGGGGGGGAAAAGQTSSDPSSELASRPARAEPPRITLFDDQLSNVTWTYNTAKQNSASLGTGDWAAQYFEGTNFYIYIRGTDDPEGDWWHSHSDYKLTHRKGGVLVNSHFDSVSTAFGATDDGMAVVSMLQLLSYFTSENRQPRNGIILLFNNAEEDGLLGARAFGNSPLVQFCRTFVNLEGAGAGGRAMLFRATDLESAEAYSRAPHPFGSIVAANSFDLGVIRSGTDYSVFYGDFGLRGLDVAFYEPRARYHTEDDDARHASVNSIWHMLSAAVAATEKFSQTTGTTFSGDRPDGNKDLAQNGKPTRGVWFDIFGRAWAAFPLRGLFAWSLSLLVATPLVLLVVTYILIRQDKYYFFARDIKIHSELNDDPVRIGGWKGFFRFPLALTFSGALTIASVLLVAKVNPLIVYSSSYAVWAMTLSLFYFALWLVMRGGSFVRPSALHRGYVNIWLFVLTWAVQVLAAVVEDRMHLGALYATAFLHSAVFVSLFISLCELFALPKKYDFALMLHDAHQERDIEGYGDEGHVAQHDGHDDGDDEDEEEPEPTETTPLTGGQQDHGAGQTTFASTYRRSVSGDPPAAKHVRMYQPYESEQSWSGNLPTWTWIIQFLLLAPMPVILFGNLGLVAQSSLKMTGTDGGSLLTPLLLTGLLSIILLLPLSPFIHRISHHIPLLLLTVFVGTFIYNLVAFPFSTNNRFKFYFMQVVDLDQGTDMVSLSGIDEYVRSVVDSLPNTADQDIKCHHSSVRDFEECWYDASSMPPNVVSGKKPEELMTVKTSRAADGRTANVQVDALDTRTCYLDLSEPVYGFSVEGGGPRDPRFGALPADGFQKIQVWRRDWDGPWNITLQLTEGGREESRIESPPLDGNAAAAEPLTVRVRCAWSDINEPSNVPAFRELQKYMPTWSVATKQSSGLVEVWKTYTIPSSDS